MQTPDGVHFGLFQDKPLKPAPTLFIIAGSIQSMASDPTRFYTMTGNELAKHGWLYVVLDPACEGYQSAEGVPGGLNGWAHHLKAGHNFMAPYVRQCSTVLDHLLEQGYADPGRIAVSGTSRGAFCAFHFAAIEPRIQVVTAISPVVNPRALKECREVTEDQAKPVNIDSYVRQLVGRTVWLTIGNDDQRVATNDTILLAQKLIAATREIQPGPSRIPVHLTIGPSLGHRAIDDVYALEGRFLLQQFPSLLPQ